MTKIGQNHVTMLEVHLSSTSLDRVLSEVQNRSARVQKSVIFTPNPEFLVYGHHHPRFVRLLNQADYNLPDGVGIIIWNFLLRVWRSTFVKASADKVERVKRLLRVPGSVLTEKLLILANEKRWRIGIAGARGGERAQQELQLTRLQARFPGLKIENLDIENRKLKIDLIFACHGMVKQEEWILAKKNKINGLIFLGIGGSLDYLTGFVSKPPAWVRRAGVEWLWRLMTRSGHLRRVLRASFEFSWLMFKTLF